MEKIRHISGVLDSGRGEGIWVRCIPETQNKSEKKSSKEKIERTGAIVSGSDTTGQIRIYGLGHYFESRLEYDERGLRKIYKYSGIISRKILIALIKFYQRAISPAFPHTCRFYPTCSNYSIEAIEKYGIFKGGLMSIWRIVRCNPFNPGGYDPVR